MLIVRNMRQAQEASRYWFSLVTDFRDSHCLVEPCGLDCMQKLLAIRPVRTTGNSGLLGIPGSVSRSPTEIERTWMKLHGRE